MVRVKTRGNGWQRCQLCGRKIRYGEQCYKVVDDFQPDYVSWEHVCCDKEKRQALWLERNRRKG